MCGSISVLQVDDGDVADLTARHLERAGDLSLDHVESAEAALGRIERGGVDCVLSEYDLSEGGDLERLEIVRAEHPDLPYLLITRDQDPEAIGRALDAGATDYVYEAEGEPAFSRLAARIRNAVHARNGTGASERGDDLGDDHLVEELPDGVVVVDESETVREVNEAAREILGTGGTDPVGRSLPALVEAGAIGEDYLSGYRDAVEALRDDEADAAPFEFDRSHDGESRIYEARLERRPGDGFRGTVGTIRDVTEHRQREDELERYETLLRTIPDTVVMTDVEGNHIEVHGFEGWSGYSREELLEKNIADTMPQEHVEKAAEVAVELFQDDERQKATYEMEVETKDGERVPFENHLRLLPPDDDGMVPGTMSVLRNIEDRKERERQLNALNESMRELITAESPEEMAELVVDTARDVLGFELTTVAFHDEAKGHLVPAATASSSDELLGEVPATGDCPAWEAYQAGEIRTYDDVSAVDGLEDRDSPAASELICPIGEYGVLILGSRTPQEFEDREVSLAEILAGNVEAALDRLSYLTELEERERELEHYETAVESTEDGIAVMEIGDEGTEIRLVNSVFANNLGVARDDLIGESMGTGTDDRVLDSPDDLRERWVEAGGEAREEGTSTFRYEATLRTDDGGEKITDNRVTATVLEDGTLIFVVVARDVSEEKERQRRIEALHESTRELMAAESKEAVAREVVSAVETTLGFPANVVRLVDETGKYLEPVAVTDRARELLGDRSAICVGEHPIGSAFRDGEVLLWDDLREHTDAYDDSAVRSLVSVPIGEYGTLSIVDDEVGAYGDSDVQIAEILASNAESAFDRVEKEEALRARERELSRQIDRLDQFASVVSHDLRNPLNVAKGHLSFVRDLIDDPEHVETIEGALERMEAIIQDVLTLAREGDEATDLVPVDIGETVEACWENVDTRQATLEVDADRRVMADESRMQQLFENLLRNGIDHVGDDVTIRVGDLDGGFYVEDDGPGIPEEDREQVFETGFSTSSEGTGFGLNIVRTIAEAHDWEVALTDGSDGGARFEFTGVDWVTE